MSSEKKKKKVRPTQLTHLSESGEARMVDIGGKSITARRAVAEAEVSLGAAGWRALKSGDTPKGDAIAVARIAGIQAAKRTADLIPLCHPLRLTHVSVQLTPVARGKIVRIRAEVRCEEKTGVEMEALTAVSVASLALYDMLKAVDKSIEIGSIKLIEKTGGKSGDWKRAK